MATLLDILRTELETYHGVLDLANAFFGNAIADELQDPFAFNGRVGSRPSRSYHKGTCILQTSATIGWHMIWQNGINLMM